ncbi:hypothetical protein JOL79_21820 [Microbispora sp. RL4-1S]|uniref:Uncharacterized protein n=1 Tax=Microbispora oryzae TaxID=2806554 RepID=A0A941AKT6_9ACTN|nr:hypothetical protein [Microbispora oryzae]MBP2706452.1 hypothetical protein [Microbispora oryzae]
MFVTTTTHLNLQGDARAALGYCQSVLGGRIAAVTYKDMGGVHDENSPDPACAAARSTSVPRPDHS